MFRQILSQTPLYNEVANDYFVQIKGETFNGDSTFVSTMRMLLPSRMTDGDTVSIEFHNISKGKRQIENTSLVDLLDSLALNLDYLDKGQCLIYSLNGDSESNTAMFKKLKEELCGNYQGWQIVEKVEVFFRKTFSAVCFINPENKNFVVFVDNMDTRKHHYLQCGLLAFMPWYFNPEQGISDAEMQLIHALREKTSEKYEKCLAEYAKQFDFRTIRIQKMLAGFETKYERRELVRVESEIENCIRRINEHNEQIASYLKDKRDKEIRLRGLKERIADSNKESEVMTYFLCNKNIVLENVSESSMTFSVTGYVTYFDEDEAENVIENSYSYIYEPDGEPCDKISPEDIKALMTAIFVDKTLKMKFCASYTLQLSGNVVANSSHDFSAVDFEDCTPNVHIDRYECMGNYTRIINELLMKNDYIGAIEQCVASAVSLNFSDQAVMEEFMKRIYGISHYNVNMRCIELPDGTIAEPKQAIEYLNSNKQEVESNG